MYYNQGLGQTLLSRIFLFKCRYNNCSTYHRTFFFFFFFLIEWNIYMHVCIYIYIFFFLGKERCWEFKKKLIIRIISNYIYSRQKKVLFKFCKFLYIFLILQSILFFKLCCWSFSLCFINRSSFLVSFQHLFIDIKWLENSIFIGVNSIQFF